LPIRRCDSPDDWRAHRSVSQPTVSKYVALSRRIGTETCFAHSYTLQGVQLPCRFPTNGHTRFGIPRRGNIPPRSSTHLSRLPSRRFHHEPSWIVRAYPPASELLIEFHTANFVFTPLTDVEISLGIQGESDWR